MLDFLDMLQHFAGELETRLAQDRVANFCGSAMISFEHLNFEHNPDKTKVKRLIKIMRTEGCLKFEPLNRIKAYIEQGDLNSAISLSGITAEELFESGIGKPSPLIFPEGFQITAGKGASRIEAAKQVLHPQDQVWAVELFLTDTTLDLKRAFAERTLNDTPLEDLVIFYNIRQAQRENDDLIEGRWRVRLPNFKRRYLSQFLKHEEIVFAFDKVLRMPGQRFGMTMSNIHDFLGLNCPDEILHYLRYLNKRWSEYFNDDEELICQVDRETVEAVQFLAPTQSLTDRDHLISMVENRIILNFVTNEDVRERILNNLLETDSFVPSMQSLAQDTKFLGLHAHILTDLFGDSQEPLRSRMTGCFKGNNQRSGYFRVQESEFSLREHQGGPDEQLNMGIVQLWLYSGRFLRRMKQNKRSITWQRFAALAYQLGFESPQIQEQLSEQSKEDEAGAMLLDIRPPPEYKYDPDEFVRFKKEVAYMISQAREISASDGPVEGVSNLKGGGVHRQYGNAFQAAMEQHRHQIFLKRLWEQSENQDHGSSVLFVVSSVYKAFLGDLLHASIQDNLGIQANEVLHLSTLPNRNEIETGSQEVSTTRSDAGETVPLADRHTHSETTTSVHVHLTEQVANLQTDIQLLQQQLQVQRRCNEELLEHTTDAQTRERQLEAQTKELESKLQESEELTEGRLCEIEQNAQVRLAQARKNLEEADHNARVSETELERALDRLESVTSEHNRLMRFSQEQSSEIEDLRHQITASRDTLEETQKQAASQALILHEEIATLQTESENLERMLTTQENRKLLENTPTSKPSLENEGHPQTISAVSDDELDDQSLIVDTNALETHPRVDRNETNRLSLDHYQPLNDTDSDKRADIHFAFQEQDGNLVHLRTVKMTAAELERALRKGQRKGVHALTRLGCGIDPKSAWNVVVNDGSRTIVETRMSRAAFFSQDPNKAPQSTSSDTLITKKTSPGPEDLYDRDGSFEGASRDQEDIRNFKIHQRGPVGSSSQAYGFQPNRRGEPNLGEKYRRMR